MLSSAMGGESAGGTSSVPPEAPRVSVVIPARNEEALVGIAVASVAAQRYPPDRLECVVVDNGSTDDTSRVAREVAAWFPQLVLTLVEEPRAGTGHAKNRGAEVAGGEILLFLDADSRMHPDLTREVARHYEAGDLAGSIRVVGDSSDAVERGFFDLMEVGHVLFGIRGQMFYCDRALFRSLGGFDPGLQLAEDLEFLKRAGKYLRDHGGGNIGHVRRSVIWTSPRRLRRLPYHLGIVPMFARWALASMGIWRTRRY
jgi:glycosyltransferase involved in cell wall biosynthesis